MAINQLGYAVVIKGQLSKESARQITADIKAIEKNFDGIKIKVKNLPNTNKGMKELNKQSKIFSQSIGDATRKFLEWTAISTMIFGTVKSLKQGIEAVVELNTALVELRKVTNLSTEGMALFTNEASDAGDTVARSTRDIVDASAQFARMGYSPEVSLRLGTLANLFVNIGDGIENTDQAAAAIIATLKGFNLEASQTEHVLDAINEVSNRYSVNSAGLASGIQRVSASMSAANNTFEETLGLFTAVNEVTQNAERSSTGLRTIAMRLRGVSDDGKDLKDLLPKLESQFQAIGLTLYSSQGTFKSTYDILGDLAGKWKGLSDETQAALTYSIAGIRRSEILEAALSNYGTAVDATKDALNSFGSATKENDIYMQSIKASVDQFNASLKDMWIHGLNSEHIKSIIDFGTGLIEVADSLGIINVGVVALGLVIGGTLIPKVNALTVALGATMSQAAALNIAMGGLIALAGVALVAAIDAGTTSIKEHKENITQLEGEIKSLNEQMDELKEKSDLTENEERRLELLSREVIARQQLLDLEKQSMAEKIIEGTFWQNLKQGIFAGYVNNTVDGLEGNLRNTFGEEKLQVYLDLVDMLKGNLLALETQLNNTDPKSQSKEYLELQGKVQEASNKLKEYSSESVLFAKEIADAYEVWGRDVPEDIQSVIDKLRELFDLSQEKKPEEVPPKIEPPSESPDSMHSVPDMTELTNAYSSVRDSIDTLTNSFVNLNDETISNGQVIDDLISNYQNLVDAGVDVEAILNNQIGLEQGLSEAYAQQVLALANSRMAMLGIDSDYTKWNSEQWAAYYAVISQFYGDDVANFVETAKSKGAVDVELAKALSGIWGEYYGELVENLTLEMQAIETIALVDSSARKELERVKNELNRLNKLNDAFKDFKPDLKSFTSNLGKVAGGADKAAKSMKKLKDNTEKTLSFVEKLENKMQIRLENLGNYLKLKQKEREEQKEINKLEEEQLKLEELKQKLANVKKQKNTRIYTETGWQWIANPDDLYDVQEEIKDQEKTLKELKDEKKYQEEIKAIQAEQDAIKQMQSAFGLLDEKMLKNIKTWEQLVAAMRKAGISFSGGAASIAEGILTGKIPLSIDGIGAEGIQANKYIDLGAGLSLMNNDLASQLVNNDNSSSSSDINIRIDHFYNESDTLNEVIQNLAIRTNLGG